MLAKPIGGQTALDQVEADLATGNKTDDPRSNNRPDHLDNDVREHLRGWKTSPNTQANGNRGIQGTAGNMTNSIGHSHHSEAKGQSYSVEPDTQIPDIHNGECCGKDCTTTATEEWPEGTYELWDRAWCEWHTILLIWEIRAYFVSQLPGSETDVREPSLCSVDN